jgi:tRNA threonylcarbamoyladenosine biosynthesis protein TsaB
MKILALDFSSTQRSVALIQHQEPPGGELEFEAVETGEGPSKPFDMIEEVLRQAGIEREQIDRLAVGVGPGSYTGIRASIAVAQGWQLARGTELLGVSSVECLAATAQAQGTVGNIAVVVDAQRGEFYIANYELTEKAWRELRPLRLASASEVINCEKEGDLLLGPDAAKVSAKGKTIFPRAAVLGKLATKRATPIPGEQLEPIYLRATSFVKAPPPRILPQ